MRIIIAVIIISSTLVSAVLAYTLSDYFPLVKGAYWKYQGKGIKIEVEATDTFDAYGFKVFDFYTKTYGYAADGEEVIMSESIDSFSHDVYKTVDRIIQLRSIVRDCVFGEELVEYAPVWVVLNSPIKVGTKWRVGIDDRDGTERYRKIVFIGTIKTPVGTFNDAIKIRETAYWRRSRKVKYDAQGNKKIHPVKVDYWYAPNVGLIRYGFEVGGSKITFFELVDYYIPEEKEEISSISKKMPEEDVRIQAQSGQKNEGKISTAPTTPSTAESVKENYFLSFDIGQQTITQTSTQPAISYGFGGGVDYDFWYIGVGLSYKKADYDYREFYGKIGARILGFLSVEGGLGWQNQYISGSSSNPLSTDMTYMGGIKLRLFDGFSIYANKHNLRGSVIGISFNMGKTGDKNIGGENHENRPNSS